MVPVSLHLSNFLSYGTGLPPLDFTQFQTACLSGNNGNGKSALLDAMTWAMWGEARSNTPALLRLNQTEMRVEFCFDLAGERYRVTRSHTRAKRAGGGSLDLQVLDGISRLYQPLTRPSIRETQASINTLLRMDYPTFISSAYLKQGQADRFTQQPPAQRKQILAEILGLSHYQDISEAARAEARVQGARVDALDAQIEGVERFLSGRMESQRLFDFYTNSLAQLRLLLEAQQKQVDDLGARIARLDERRARADTVAAELATEQLRTSQLESALHRLQAQKADADSWIAETDTLVANFQKWRVARNEAERWDAACARHQELAAKYQQLRDAIREAGEGLFRLSNEVEAKISHDERVVEANVPQLARAPQTEAGVRDLAAARLEVAACVLKCRAFDAAQQRMRDAETEFRQAEQRVQLQLESVAGRLAEAQSRAARLPEAIELVEEAERRLVELELANQRTKELREEHNAADVRLRALKQRSEHEAAQIEANEQKLRVLLANPQAQCPLCEADLGAHGLQHIESNINDDINQRRLAMVALATQGRQARKEKQAKEAALAEVQALLCDMSRHADAASARAALAVAQEAVVAVEAVEAEHHQLLKALETRNFDPAASQRLVTAQEEVAAIDYDPAAQSQVTQRIDELSRFDEDNVALSFARAQTEEARERLLLLRRQLQQTRQQLDAGAFAPTEKALLSSVKQQVDELGYDAEAKAAHATAKETCQRLHDAALRYDRLKDISARLPDIEAELARASQNLADHAERLTNLAHEQVGLADVGLQLLECERARAEALAVRDALRKDERDAASELGRQQGILEACAVRETERTSLAADRIVAAREAFILKQTSAAFGKDGIPALIIENAIPELQDEANAILRRLSRNHMQISIESLREKQSGGSKETLDIKISDDRGTREYLMYSGGEAFRADFALRIALSKLLARRAGAQLRTLIVDEGFGTQDAEGLQNMIECIQAISDDFSKVLVVTHLDVIKNAFQTRIEVTKQADTGSRYEVLTG